MPVGLLLLARGAGVTEGRAATTTRGAGERD